MPLGRRGDSPDSPTIPSKVTMNSLEILLDQTLIQIQNYSHSCAIIYLTVDLGSQSTLPSNMTTSHSWLMSP